MEITRDQVRILKKTIVAYLTKFSQHSNQEVKKLTKFTVSIVTNPADISSVQHPVYLSPAASPTATSRSDRNAYKISVGENSQNAVI